jgi:Mrp family chromosome partitioning ATPase
LLVGDRLVSRCDDGLLEAEYALFDRSEVLLSPDVREEGYMTRAGFARSRLHESKVTADLAYEAFAALRGRMMRPLARSSAVREVIDHLGPYETFQGGRFMASRGRYRGLWLNLDTLAAECPLRSAAVLLQALHLMLVLEEVSEDAPIRLLTSNTGKEMGAGGRTWRRVDLELVQRLPWVLREMQAPAGSADGHDEAEVREDILRDLRARAAATAVAQPRLATLAAAIARTGSTPPAPPSPADSGGAADIAATLRQYNDLLHGSDSLRSVAQSLSARVEQTPVPDLAILAARAWLAAGEPSFARHFASLVVDNASAADDLRVLALEIVEATGRTLEASRPPPATPPAPVIVVPAPEGGHIPQPSPAATSLVRRPTPILAQLMEPPRAPPPDVPPLGERRRLDPRLVLLSEPDSQRAASFRLLRDNLLAKGAPRIIAVSSGAVHEGKTTCAINLALALHEKPATRVLLMEGNFFEPSLAGIFGIDASARPDPVMNLPMLSPYRIVQMMGGFHVAALVQQAGDPPPSFNSRWFDMVIDHLSGAGYDHVVIDAAALDGSPVVTQVLGIADGTLLTVRSHATTARSLRRAAEQIPTGRALGVTLMDAET